LLNHINKNSSFLGLFLFYGKHILAIPPIDVHKKQFQNSRIRQDSQEKLVLINCLSFCQYIEPPKGLNIFQKTQSFSSQPFN